MPGERGEGVRARRREALRRGFRGRSVTIGYSLARNLMLMILLTAGAILAVSILWSSRVVSELSAELIAQRIERTEQELEKFFRPMENALLLFGEWGGAGLFEPLDAGPIGDPGAAPDPERIAEIERLNALFVPVLERFPQITSVMIANAEGGEYMLLLEGDRWRNRITDAERWGQETLWLHHPPGGGPAEAEWRSLDYDPRRRPWYRGAIEAAPGTRSHWTEPYRFFTTRDPGITASLRWRPPGAADLDHVIAVDVMLIDLSRFTTSLEVSERGKVLILAEDGAVAGLPRDPRFPGLEDHRARVLKPVVELGSPELVDAARAWQERGLRPGSVLAFESGGETWWGGVKTFRLGERDFRIAVVVPQNDFLGEIDRQRNVVIAITAVALGIAFFVAMALARSYSRPLAALAEQAERIEHLDVETAEPIVSRLREVEQLAQTQERMRTALDSFARYVPTDVVRELMKRGEAAQIGGARETITVLFTDVQNFTTIAEAMTPEALTRHMAEYFEAMLGTVQSDGFGEVTQLAGDGFVAFWGAPVPCAEHAARALEGVLRCRERLAELNARWSAHGLPELPTRFGLATGPVVVGNVGSPVRLVYTAVGDTINLANRVEGINRFYGTWVMASDSVRRAAGEGFEWRRVDRVRAKGKTAPIDLHELLGRRGEVARPALEFAARYEEALDLYQSRRFAESATALEGLLAAAPGDLSATRLLALARDLEAHPPEEDWDGTTVFEIK